MDVNYILNNGNVFNLSKLESLSISLIQFEIFNQYNKKGIDDVKLFFNTNIDITKTIYLTNGLTIHKILKDSPVSQTFFSNDDITNTTVGVIFSLLHLWLFKKLSDSNHKDLLPIENYKNEYQNYKKDFININLDATEKDFIKSEKRICKKILFELKKPIYNEICIIDGLTVEPTHFKSILKRSINRRLEYLKSFSNVQPKAVKKIHDYLKISTLIAQGFLVEVKTNEYSYKNIMYSKSEIIKKLESELNIKSVRQYIEGTFGANKQTTLKNDFFRNETKIKETVKYCNDNNLTITDKYKTVFDELN